MMKSTFRLLVILAFWLPFQDHCDAQRLLLESLRDSLVRSAMFPSEVELIEPSDGQGGSGPTMDHGGLEPLNPSRQQEAPHEARLLLGSSTWT